MRDVIQVAQERRTALMEEIEGLMAEVEELDNFISFGQSLVPTAHDEPSMTRAAE